ncbi:MAG: hypothetical protein IKN98_01165 [Bacteroidales bacterium]|nr:hypothetical protein [Bacteroidales bacterium]
MNQRQRTSIEKIRETDFEAVSEYFTTGNTTALTETQQRILERLRTAHAIMRKYPRKSVAALKLQARFPEISKEQAYCDIRNACRLWNKYDPVDRDFLEGWFLDWLMREISDPSTSDNARAKNLATLQKFLSQLPPQKIDPKLMETNQIYVQFNINNKQVKIPETVLMKLPDDIRRQLLGSLDDEITEETACEIINS